VIFTLYSYWRSSVMGSAGCDKKTVSPRTSYTETGWPAYTCVFFSGSKSSIITEPALADSRVRTLITRIELQTGLQGISTLTFRFATREEILNPVDTGSEMLCSPAFGRRLAREFKTANSEFAYTIWRWRPDNSILRNQQTHAFQQRNPYRKRKVYVETRRRGPTRW